MTDDEQISEQIKRMLETMRKDREIWCPFCGEKQDDETRCHHVSYWGEDSNKNCTCGSCGEAFFVKENVERTFKSAKTEDELDGD